MRLWITRIRPVREELWHAARDEVVESLLGFEGILIHGFPASAGYSLMEILEISC